MNKKKSVHYINLYRGIAALLLVGSNVMKFGDDVCRILSVISVSMIFISFGMEYYYEISEDKEKDSEVNIFSDIASKYLVMYLYFSALLFISQLVIKYGMGREFGFKESITDFLSLNGMSFLWIPAAAFVATALYRLLRAKIGFVKTMILIVVLIILYIPISNLPSMLDSSDNMGRQFVFKVFLMTWRSIIMSGFICLGELIERINKKINYKHIVTVPTGIAMVVASVFLSNMNDTFEEYKYLSFGKSYLFVVAAILGGCGILFICEWIRQLKYLEFFGRYMLVVAVTHYDWGITKIAAVIDDIMLKVFDNHFVSGFSDCLFIVAVEILIIWLFGKILFRMVGMKKENPFKAVNDVKVK